MFCPFAGASASPSASAAPPQEQTVAATAIPETDTAPSPEEAPHHGGYRPSIHFPRRRDAEGRRIMHEEPEAQHEKPEQPEDPEVGFYGEA